MAPRKESIFATSALRILFFAISVLQWSSGVIVLGMVVRFLSQYSQGGHLKYDVCVASLNTLIYGTAQFYPILKAYKGYSILLHLTFSYLWLTSFIFAAQDYDYGNCANNAPPDSGLCTEKYVLQAFAFVAFFCTFLAIPLDGLLYVFEHYKNPAYYDPAPHTNGHSNGVANGHTATPALMEKSEDEKRESSSADGVTPATATV